MSGVKITTSTQKGPKPKKPPQPNIKQKTGKGVTMRERELEPYTCVCQWNQSDRWLVSRSPEDRRSPRGLFVSLNGPNIEELTWS